MPLYEYECKKCHHRIEKIQSFSASHMKKCPDCGGRLEQVISAPAVQFKGSGWYVTDYAKKASAASSSNGDSGAKAESSPKTDSGESNSKDSNSKDSSSKDSSSKDSGAKSEASSKSESGSKKESKSKSETSGGKSDKK
jgi:putative FmdB family regulatory protein